MTENFEDKVSNSFIKVRKDMNFIVQELNKVKKFLILKNNEISSLKSQINALDELINTKLVQIQSISTGNGRVINPHQQSSTIINNDLSTRKNFNENQEKPMRMLIESKFRSLTDMEFAIFMTIYELEENLGKVTYKDIANKFNLTEATIRNHITNLVNKGIPIDKERLFNKRTLFYIKKDFRELNIASRLLEIRQIPKNPVDKTEK